MSLRRTVKLYANKEKKIYAEVDWITVLRFVKNNKEFIVWSQPFFCSNNVQKKVRLIFTPEQIIDNIIEQIESD